MPRIPGITVLVRIERAAKSESGLEILSARKLPAPPYAIKEGAARKWTSPYDTTTWSTPLRPGESTYYRAYKASIVDEFRARKANGQSGPLATVRERAKECWLKVVQKEGGSGVEVEGASDAKLLKWLDERMDGPPGSFIVHADCTPYCAKEGFQVEIDCLHNMPGKAWHGKNPQLFSVMYCLASAEYSVARSFYDEDAKVKLTDRLGITKRHLWRSAWKHQAFDDGPFSLRVKYGEVEHDENLVLILDVRAVDQDAKKKGKFVATSVGWTALQIFFPHMGAAADAIREAAAREEEARAASGSSKKKKKKKRRHRGARGASPPGYVQNGTHQLPLFVGAPSLAILDAMEKKSFHAVVDDDQNAKKEARELSVMAKTKSSIVVKLWDSQLDPRGVDDERVKCTLDDFDKIEFRSELLKRGSKKTGWTINEAEVKKDAAAAPLSKVLPKGLDEDEYETKSRAAMKKFVEGGQS